MDSSAKTREQSSASRTDAGAGAGSDLPRDPVCGMTVDPRRAAGSYQYNGKSYYFCSTHCLEKFPRNTGALSQSTC